MELIVNSTTRAVDVPSFMPLQLPLQRALKT
jgi:hypothetical protein